MILRSLFIPNAAAMLRDSRSAALCKNQQQKRLYIFNTGLDAELTVVPGKTVSQSGEKQGW